MINLCKNKILSFIKRNRLTSFLLGMAIVINGLIIPAEEVHASAADYSGSSAIAKISNGYIYIPTDKNPNEWFPASCCYMPEIIWKMHETYSESGSYHSFDFYYATPYNITDPLNYSVMYDNDTHWKYTYTKTGYRGFKWKTENVKAKKILSGSGYEDIETYWYVLVTGNPECVGNYVRYKISGSAYFNDGWGFKVFWGETSSYNPTILHFSSSLPSSVIMPYSNKKHSLATKVSEATCTEPAKYRCSDCNAIVSKPFDFPLYHTYGYANGDIVQEQTCTLPEERYNKCTRCGETNGTCISKNPLGHLWDDGTITLEPTCTEKGIKTYKCTREGCNGTRTEDIEPLGHIVPDEGVIVRQPECTTKGVKNYFCARGCGGIAKTEEIPELGHTGFVTVEATCVNPGYTYCTRCYQHTNDWAPLGHNFLTPTLETNNGVKTAPTCTKDGIYYKKCSRCNTLDINEFAVIPNTAIGHKYVGVESPRATVYSPGLMVYTCENDHSHQYTEEIPQKHFQIYNDGLQINKVYLGDTLIMNASFGTEALVK